MKRPNARRRRACGGCRRLFTTTYDEGYVILKGATAKENFTVMGFDENKINVTSVKTEKDWKDIEKHEDSDITVELPAAG
jgi:transcriptional regulator NrdR family protein